MTRLLYQRSLSTLWFKHQLVELTVAEPPLIFCFLPRGGPELVTCHSGTAHNKQGADADAAAPGVITTTAVYIYVCWTESEHWCLFFNPWPQFPEETGELNYLP